MRGDESEERLKQRCLGNCLVMFRRYELPHVRLLKQEVDRCFFEYTADFESRVLELEENGRFAAWNYFTGGHGSTAKFGFRETEVRCSMQIIFHAPDRSPAVPNEIEVDFDFWNPERGLAPLMLHGLEILWNGIRRRRTSPFAIAGIIAKRLEKGEKA